MDTNEWIKVAAVTSVNKFRIDRWYHLTMLQFEMFIIKVEYIHGDIIVMQYIYRVWVYINELIKKIIYIVMYMSV